MEWRTETISQMRRLRLQEGRDLSEDIAQPNYLEAREAKFNSKDLLLEGWKVDRGRDFSRQMDKGECSST